MSSDGDLQARAEEIARKKRCGALVTTDGVTEVRLCCDPTLHIARYAESDCACLQEARGHLVANKGPQP